METAGVTPPREAAIARADDPFLHIRDGAAASESQYQLAVHPEQPVTGSATASLGDFIATQLGTRRI